MNKIIKKILFPVASIFICLRLIPACGVSSSQNTSTGSGSGSNSSFKVTPSSTNATSTPSIAQTVASGATTAFAVVAATGDTLSQTVSGTCPSGKWNNGTYTTGAIIANCSVEFSATAQTFTVTPSVDAHTTSTPSTAQTVAYGSTQAFTVTAAASYTLSTSVGGTCAAGSWTGGQYTTGVISGNCTVSFASVPFKKIFLTSATTEGNLSGPTGADALCQADTNKPSDGGTYKALLSDNSTRIACTTANCGTGVGEHTGWILQASTTYYLSDAVTVFGTTNSNGIFSFPVTTALNGAADFVWTGIAQDWTNTSNCSAWTDNGCGGVGQGGRSNQTSNNFINLGTGDIACCGPHYLYCVEQ